MHKGALPSADTQPKIYSPIHSTHICKGVQLNTSLCPSRSMRQRTRGQGLTATCVMHDSHSTCYKRTCLEKNRKIAQDSRCDERWLAAAKWQRTLCVRVHFHVSIKHSVSCSWQRSVWCSEGLLSVWNGSMAESGFYLSMNHPCLSPINTQ